jgi:hypothetical protein
VDDPFLPEEPLELIKKGCVIINHLRLKKNSLLFISGKYNKVPLIIGTNKDEGLLIKGFYMRNPKNFQIGYDNWKTIGPLAFFARYS